MGIIRRSPCSGKAFSLMAALAIGWFAGPLPTLAQPQRGIVDNRTPEQRRIQSNRTAERPLLLRAGRIPTDQVDEDLSTFVQNLRRTGRRAVLQFDGPLTPERRTLLSAAGVRLGGYIPDNAFIADLSGVDGAALNALDFVRWQGEFDPAWKRDPMLGRRQFVTPARQALAQAGRSELIITLFEGAAPESVIEFIGKLPNAPIVYYSDELAGSSFIVATLDARSIDQLAAHSDVQFIEETPELTDRSNTNNRWIVQSNVPDATPLYDAGLRGEDQIIGILDGASGGLDMNHCSFKDNVNNTPGPAHRKVLAYNSPTGALTHATHVSATAAGDNGIDDNTRGVAWAAKIVYAARPAFNEMSVYNALTLHHTQGARVHSNSWGDDTVSWYTSLCRGMDSFVYDNEESLVCVAVTNTATLRAPENSKNVLAVGASQGAPNQESFCLGGVGPTADGRRKPEIFAPGCFTVSAQSNTGCGTSQNSGTSMACPAVAGAAVLTRQYFEMGFYPTGTPVPMDALTPSAALLKGALINSAVDMTGIPGFPSDQEGWGRVLADNALYFVGDARRLVIQDVRNLDGLVTGEITALAVDVSSSSEPLKITLAWTEPPATLGADLVQVNNLDLEVIDPVGAVYRGNVFEMGQSAIGGVADDRNNVEQVLISAPLPGPWTIRMRGTAINVGSQGYAMVATGDISESSAPLSLAVEAPPSMIAPGTALTVRATINPGDDALVGGSPLLHYRFDNGPFISTPLVYVTGQVYEATLPAVTCSDSPQFFAEAAGVATGAISDPPDHPTFVYTVEVGSVSTPFFDDFEIDNGWTGGAPGDTATAGQWERVAPIGTSAQPAFDHTPDPGTICWVTGQHVEGQGDGFSDVDGGFTTLLSPIFDLSSYSTVRLSYWRWFYTTSSGIEDSLRVDISHDGGGTWFNVETLGNTTVRLQTLGGWFNHTFDPTAIVPELTSNMRMRFVATDNNPGSIVEAAIDDFAILTLDCVTPPFCEGDANGDHMVDFDDITEILSNWGAVYAPGSAGLGDANNDGAVDFDDITAVLVNWDVGCL